MSLIRRIISFSAISACIFLVAIATFIILSKIDFGSSLQKEVVIENKATISPIIPDPQDSNLKVGDNINDTQKSSKSDQYLLTEKQKMLLKNSLQKEVADIEIIPPKNEDVDLIRKKIEDIKPLSVVPAKKTGQISVKVIDQNDDVVRIIESSIFESSYNVQIGAYFTEEDAQQIINATKSIPEFQGKKIFINQKSQEGNSYYTVQVGPFDTKSVADGFCNIIKDQYECFTVKF